MPVVKPVRSKTLLATLSVLVVVAGMLLGARVAVADSVWYQSYQRASQAEACAAQVGETPWQASWGADSSWYPTWEQWANSGKGDWVCSRSITWARDSAARTYALGDIGPGGGLVFLISGGLTYEMAPNTWSGAGTPDVAASWCDGFTDVPAATGTAVGTGAANTAAMAASVACSSNAVAAVLAYAPAGTSAGQWYLPSTDELNAMCNFARNPTTPPTGACTGLQDVTFSTGRYGFAGIVYWTSTQSTVNTASIQLPDDGSVGASSKSLVLRIRPVRAF